VLGFGKPKLSLTEIKQRRHKYTAHILRTNRVGSDKNHLYLDSGLGKHMVKSLIENFVKSLSPEIIEMADGRKITIDCAGNGTIDESFKLNIPLHSTSTSCRLPNSASKDLHAYLLQRV
jgi:hypothetical protein